MRSVQLFPALDLESLTQLLDGVGQRSGCEWFDIADGRVEVSVRAYGSVSAMVEDLERQGIDPVAVARIRHATDDLSAVWVEVRISGRGDFQAEMLELVGRVLAVDGLGVDDYSDGAWSLDEIRNGRGDGVMFRA